MEVRVYSPNSLNEDGALNFIAHLSHYAEADSIVLDFSRTTFARPLGSLMFIAEFLTFIKTKPRAFKAEGIDLNRDAHGYLGHMGFFHSLNIPYGRLPGESTHGSSYVPITFLTRDQLEQSKRFIRTEAGDLPHLGDVIKKESMRLAGLITGDKRPRINRPIAYCFREIIRNVFEHAEIDTCGMYAQKWKDGYIEVAIVDRGIGIQTSLQPRLSLATDAEALKAAIEPGVSSKSGGHYSDWANSGFGLFILSELGKRLGTFTLCSGSTVLKAEKRKIKVKDYQAAFNGTAVGLRIRLIPVAEFSKLIEELIEEGEAIAATKGEVVKASRSTRMN